MKTSMAVAGATLALVIAASPARAQIVEAGVVIRSGPIRGHVVVGEPAPVVVYREPARRVVVDWYEPRTILAERIHQPWGRARGWWWRHGYGVTTVYYDHRSRHYRHHHDRDWDD